MYGAYNHDMIEPEDDTVDEATFRRAFATVLRRYATTFRKLAEFDSGAEPRLAKKI